MKKDFVLRLLPLDPKHGGQLAHVPAGTPLYLSAPAEFGGMEDTVLVSLEPDGAEPIGRVAGNDQNRLYTRLQRGSIATATVQGEGPRGALEIEVHVEDFGNDGLPVDGRAVLPSRPARRTEAVDFADAAPTFTKDDVNAWVRQIAARIGETESRGEDLDDFMREQLAEVSAFKARLPEPARQRFSQWYAAEVERLDDSYGLARELLSGQTPHAPGKFRRWFWIIVLTLLVIALIYESR